MIELVTERLILRVPTCDDFDAFADFYQDQRATLFLNGPQSRPIAWRTFATIVGSWSLNGFGYFSVIERVSGTWAGRVGPWRPEGWPGPEVGWALRTEMTGKGYAFEAAQAAIGWAFDSLGWDRVIHCIEPANDASIALAKRLGARRLYQTELPPPLQGHPTDVYGQCRADWLACNKSANKMQG